MTIVATDAAGFAAAESRLSGGEPIIIPTPSPLAYVFFSDVPGAINEAKGRPAGLQGGGKSLAALGAASLGGGLAGDRV